MGRQEVPTRDVLPELEAAEEEAKSLLGEQHVAAVHRALRHADATVQPGRVLTVTAAARGAACTPHNKQTRPASRLLVPCQVPSKCNEAAQARFRVLWRSQVSYHFFQSKE